MPAPLYVGARVEHRQQPWRVKRVQPAAEGHHLVELELLEPGEPRALTVLAPPDELARLAPEALRFDLQGF